MKCVEQQLDCLNLRGSQEMLRNLRAPCARTDQQHNLLVRIPTVYIRTDSNRHLAGGLTRSNADALLWASEDGEILSLKYIRK